MINRSDLLQLERDAQKEGAWQAKLAYAIYLIQYNQEQKETAKNFLNEVINANIQEYTIEARYLYARHFPKDGVVDAIEILSAKKAKKHVTSIHSLDHDAIYSRKMGKAPEIKYKLIRREFEHAFSYQNADKTNIIATCINKLENLLDNEEMTDTLQAKIYFQLIHMYLEQAKLAGQRHQLEKAKEYTLLLTNDLALSSMRKAKQASRIYNEIEKITKSPILDFTAYVNKLFEKGREPSRIAFKYIGIVIGTVLDVCTLGLSKLCGKWTVSKATSDLAPRENRTTSETLLKNSGLAALFKYIGKKVGKYVIGSFVTGAFAGLLGVMSYPFVYCFNRYKKDKAVSQAAINTINLAKENKKDNQTRGENNGTLTSTKLIFSKRIDNDVNKTIPYTDNLDKKVYLKHIYLSSKPEKTCLKAYSSVFSQATDTKKDVDQTLKPVYIATR